MECKVSFENKTFSDEKQAANELAFCHYPVEVSFCHYPVEVSAGGKTPVFVSFDEARRFVAEVFSAGAGDGGGRASDGE